MEYVILTLLTAISAIVLLRTFRIADATYRRDIITDDIAGCCESLGFVGCSVICSSVKDIEHIEELLGQEYDRYEVIITLDAEQYAEEFRAIVARYHLIRVNCSPSEELPSATIRRLYRSRQRSFRRLILIDRELTDLYDDLDAATAVSSYNYLLPIGHNTHLCSMAVESIAITLSEQEARRVEIFYSVATDSFVFHRDAVIANGGFSPHIIKQISPSRWLWTYTPLTFCRSPRVSILPAMAMMIVALLLVYQLAGHIMAIATAATIILIIAATTYMSRLIAPANCSLRVMLCYFRQLASIFRCRKFLIS